MLKKTTIFIAVFFCLNSFSQSISDSFSNPETIKHQLGIGISNFINSAFSSDVNAYNLEYRYKYNTKTSLRAGASYERDDSESGFIDGGVKFGIDRNLKKYQKWTFYYGVDLMANLSSYKNVNKDQYNFGIAPLLGIQYNVSPNFSLSIEPNIYFKYYKVIDKSTFLSDNITEWTQSGFGKLGYIQVNFHF